MEAKFFNIFVNTLGKLFFYYFTLGECVYDEWTAWSTCTATCGLGYKDRRKDLLEPNEHCNETITEVIGCYEGDCCKF